MALVRTSNLIVSICINQYIHIERVENGAASVINSLIDSNQAQLNLSSVRISYPHFAARLGTYVY